MIVVEAKDQDYILLQLKFHTCTIPEAKVGIFVPLNKVQASEIMSSIVLNGKLAKNSQPLKSGNLVGNERHLMQKHENFIWFLRQ